MSNHQVKRKTKMERKAAVFVPFDIDSIMQKVHVPVESQKIASAKRYFSFRKNQKKNDNKIKISRKLSNFLKSINIFLKIYKFLLT